ncbi:MAG: OmpA family protein [Vicingaceae bacterium]
MNNVGFLVLDIKAVCFILSLFFTGSVFSQSEENKFSKGQLKKMAAAAERNNDPETAAIYYEKYLEKNPGDIKVTYQLANKNRMIGNVAAAKSQYKVVFEKEKKKYPLAAFFFAEMLVASGNCKDAIPIYDDFRGDIRGEKDDRKYSRLAKFAIEGCEMKGDTSIRSNMAIKELNDAINGSHMEGAPVFISENEILYNSLKTKKSVYDTQSESMPNRLFYTANLEEGEWEHKNAWVELRNFNVGEVANGAFNLDHTRFYFSACETNSLGEVSCDIYSMDKVGSKWSTPVKLPEQVNTKYTETQVAVGIDERERETIYFVSDRKEGKGGLDIWYSTYYEDKKEYREAKNCGSRINSVGDEITPFINPINRQMIFSSNGHPSFGGFDVFKSSGERSRWSEPENIGTAINSYSDELYYVVSPAGGEGVFASNRVTPENKKRGACCDNLFYFKELDKIELIVSGKITEIESETKELDGVKVKLYMVDELGERYFMQATTTDQDGVYNLRLEANNNYIVKTEKEGFLSEEKQLSTKNMINSEKLQKDFQLNEISERAIELENVYYEYGETNLTNEGLATIDTTIYQVLLQNPSIVVEIGAHTDNVGSKGYNLNLSQLRAESVVRYLRLKGIDKSRLKAKGYGESQPLAPNENADGTDNEAGRAKNRRTEFKVIGEIEIPELED